ncbi:MAG: hypothetical protein ABSA46_14910 [Thermodesulfovibrionales bacterium]|jgi:hypothetical protein
MSPALTGYRPRNALSHSSVELLTTVIMLCLSQIGAAPVSIPVTI